MSQTAEYAIGQKVWITWGAGVQEVIVSDVRTDGERVYVYVTAPWGHEYGYLSRMIFASRADAANAAPRR